MARRITMSRSPRGVDQRVDESSRITINSNDNVSSVSTSTSSKIKQYSRPNHKQFIPDVQNLYDLANKYLILKPEINKILDNDLPGYNTAKDYDEDGHPPVPSNFIKGWKSGNVTVPKPNKLNRVMFFPRTRKIALDLLKAKGKVPQDSTLSDFYLEFVSNGEKFPGDVEPTVELWEYINEFDEHWLPFNEKAYYEALGKPKQTISRDVEEMDEEMDEGESQKVPQEDFESLSAKFDSIRIFEQACQEDDGSISSFRTKKITKLIKMIGELIDDDGLEQLLEKIPKWRSGEEDE